MMNNMFISASIAPARRMSFEEDSFTKFTMDMFKQYMKEEELRAAHQVIHNN